jgi:tRNA(Arg) A34 adenosine deaminase TadA
MVTSAQPGPADFMREAIAVSRAGLREGCGPFGAVIVRGGEIIARGCNRVTATCDPTAHAEVVVIREAARRLGNFSLAGCEIYSTCEPCPMCLAAIYWARLDRLYFANTRVDAAAAGFDDDAIYQQIPLPISERSIRTETLLGDEAWAVFEEWNAKPDKIPY